MIDATAEVLLVKLAASRCAGFGKKWCRYTEESNIRIWIHLRSMWEPLPYQSGSRAGNTGRKTDKFVWIPSLNDIGDYSWRIGHCLLPVWKTTEKHCRKFRKRDSFQKCNDRPVRVFCLQGAEARQLWSHRLRTGDLWKIQNTWFFSLIQMKAEWRFLWRAVKAEKPECPEPSPTSVPRVTVTPVGKIRQAAEMSRLITMARRSDCL